MKILNRVHLSGLRAVEAVGRLGSLAAAADELGVTVGAVSQQVQRTEASLGKTLFVRQGKRLRLNAVGEAACSHLTAGMTELASAVRLVRNETQDVLTVSVAPLFAGRWLVWRLNHFHEAYPSVRIRVDADVALVDPNTSDVDVCIRVGNGDYPGVNVEHLLDHRVFPVCSPEIGQRLKAPADLVNVPVIRETKSLFDWRVWLEPNGVDEASLCDGPVYSDGALCLDAAIAGQGVFLAWETLASDALDAGRLVAPFDDRRSTGLAYWFITAKRHKPSRHAMAFRDWLKAELA
ncbi:LysR substrate-binding domain-containing protein [Oricola cellulosilytica]|uniref:LysR family transcriptional regulator n=1 Tax=Oricola cellulosilytica TaxID=1429082 RepID=A0A4R0PEN0_9HYPH|nr:LysR substrate-binding domain-containing protein [Oricola cellulosilytica]TCD15009.1 LysR family transcriptional regulator [Oricola cellulosilytica]